MNTKLPLLALVLGMSGLLAAQNANVKTVPLAKTAKPYRWLMRPTSEFFAETGLSATDTVSANTYRVGSGAESVLVNTGHLEATNQDVVWYVAYENYKLKDLKVVVDSLKANFELTANDDGFTNYWLPDALVKLKPYGDDKLKVGNLELDAIPLYPFMPPVDQAMEKLDSTWEQLVTNVQFRPRSVERDSSKIMVKLKNVTPLVSFSVFYPQAPDAMPYVSIELNDGEGYGVMKWACKNYYDRFFDAFDSGSIWVSDTDQPIVKVGILFNTGNLLNLQMTQAEFSAMASSDE